MLVIPRKANESIVINDNIIVTVVEIRGDKVRLGIVAPKEIPVHQQEIYDMIHESPDEPPKPPTKTTEPPSTVNEDFYVFRPDDIQSWTQIEETAQEAIAAYDKSRKRLLVVSLEKQVSLSALSICCLLRIWIPVDKGGGEFALCNVSPPAMELLRLVALDKVWNIYDDVSAVREKQSVGEI